MIMEHCEICEAWAEHRRCPACGMTGTEIQETRMAEQRPAEPQFQGDYDREAEETHP